jgi:20S proteasome alpha/beta subunit
MTLCIAALCQDKGESRIVIGTDWRAETSIAGGDVQDKVLWIGPNIPVLIAGTISRAIELKNTIEQYFEQREEKKLPMFKAADVPDVLRIPVVRFKRKLVSECVGLAFGMSYSEFFAAIGTKQIPEQVAIEKLKEIQDIDQDCCLIVSMFMEDRTPRVVRIDSRGVLESVESFATIGSGSDIADGVLFQREHDENDTLGATLYHVYEAMKLGSIAPGVGKEFTVDVVYPPDKTHKEVWGEALSKKGKAFMEAQFKKRGPKQFTNFVKLPNGILERDFD